MTLDNSLMLALWSVLYMSKVVKHLKDLLTCIQFPEYQQRTRTGCDHLILHDFVLSIINKLSCKYINKIYVKKKHVMCVMYVRKIVGFMQNV